MIRRNYKINITTKTITYCLLLGDVPGGSCTHNFLSHVDEPLIHGVSIGMIGTAGHLLLPLFHLSLLLQTQIQILLLLLLLLLLVAFSSTAAATAAAALLLLFLLLLLSPPLLLFLYYCCYYYYYCYCCCCCCYYYYYYYFYYRVLLLLQNTTSKDYFLEAYTTNETINDTVVFQADPIQGGMQEDKFQKVGLIPVHSRYVFHTTYVRRSLDCALSCAKFLMCKKFYMATSDGAGVFRCMLVRWDVENLDPVLGPEYVPDMSAVVFEKVTFAGDV